MHKGHEAIIRHLTEVAGFDMVYLVVTPLNPFKEKHSMPTGEDRFKAAEEAVSRHPELKVTVKDTELKMTPPQYTVRTLDTLQAAEPDKDFTLVIGADNLESFPRWKDYARILREYGVAVFPRKGFHRGHLKQRLLREDSRYRIELIKAPLVNISSTEIREGLASGNDMSHWLM